MASTNKRLAHQDADSETIGDRVTIFKRGSQWYANFQEGRRQVRRSLKTTSKKQARQLAIKLEADLMAGRGSTARRAVLLVKLTEAYLKRLRVDGRKKKTIQKNELVVRRVLALAELRRVRSCADVNLAFVDAYKDQRVEQGAAPKTVHNEVVVIRQLVNFALSRRLIGEDSLRGLRLKKPRPTRQPCWLREDVERILAAADEVHRPALRVLADTGMRVGEARQLTWDDVDFEHGLLHVRAKDDWTPKTGEERSVPMTIALKVLLESLPRNGKWVLRAAPSRAYPLGDHQISERRLLQYLKRVLQRLGLPGHVHTFRHSFISWALTRGTPEAVVREWVGHVDRDVMKLYTHIADTVSREAMDRLVARGCQANSGGQS